MAMTEQQVVNQRSHMDIAPSVAAAILSSSHLDQVRVPSVAALRRAPHIQPEVNRCIRHLTDLNKAFKLKSQRGVNDTVWVNKVP